MPELTTRDGMEKDPTSRSARSAATRRCRSLLRYQLHDLTLEVEHLERGAARELDRLLGALSWRRTEAAQEAPLLTLSIDGNGGGSTVPAGSREVLRADDFRGYEHERDYYLTDGETLLRLRPAERRGEVRLAPSFYTRSSDSRREFWGFALVKLLQGVGVYSLHAAGVVARDGTGVLVAGAAGSGKSTLTIGLIRLGWRYLSDDAILLRAGADGVEALAFRRDFYVDSPAAQRYADLSPAEEIPDSSGGLRRRVAIEAAYAARRVSRCHPRVLLFSSIVAGPKSRLTTVDSPTALGRLLAQSARQLFEREATGKHLLVLKQLLEQTRFYDLEAGSDLYDDPAVLEKLLDAAPHPRRRVS